MTWRDVAATTDPELVARLLKIADELVRDESPACFKISAALPARGARDMQVPRQDKRQEEIAPSTPATAKRTYLLRPAR